VTVSLFHPAVREWFETSFPGPTEPQNLAWPVLAQGESALVLAPTGTGKTLAAFLFCIERLLFEAERKPGCRILYISPIKALAVDVEKNLQVPLQGISRVARTRGDPHRVPAVSIRTGDTRPQDRARFQRRPSEILITTPESLYLLLTSRSRDAFRSLETVIVDEIHAVVGTKRGAHLALSLERLEALRGGFQRIGLSATARPVDEIAAFLGGAVARREGEARRNRPVHVLQSQERKRLEVRVEVPVDDMSRMGEADGPQGESSFPLSRASIWNAIHPQLLALVRAHRTTLLFVNNRRLAERLAAALNEHAGEKLVRAHHGSLALPQRREIEESLKAGEIRGLVATSSLELGIDMASVDLVVQIEAPPSVASGMQRIGRGSHQVGATSRGVVFPKFRGDLVACAAFTSLLEEGAVEEMPYPRNPLDVLAQQVVAMVAMDPWRADDLFARVRSAAPFADLPRSLFDGVLDMLSGRYPSAEFSELRPRLVWDRVSGTLQPRDGVKRLAILNGGTIPDRGLYGVYLDGAAPGTGRVGELDEEMVFESREGEVFLLGASSWRIETITHDRVLVSPAPGVPGKMPFWKGDAVGRPAEFGRRIGELTSRLRQMPEADAAAELVGSRGLTEAAARNLLEYLKSQAEATGEVPDDRNVVIERCRDELGEFRVCVLSPMGKRVHAPWAMVVAARIRERSGVEVETLSADDGFVVRFPPTELPPEAGWFVPDPDEVRTRAREELSGTSLFAGRFREAAARALLLPRRRAAGRTPLWQQRKRSGDLLAVASRYPSFPILLEAYRECLQNLLDLPNLEAFLRKIREGGVRVTTVDSLHPSPFASAVLFGYVANFLYEGDTPLAERKAHALSIDTRELQRLLGEADLRLLLHEDALAEVEAELQLLVPERKARTLDELHDLLRRLGALPPSEIARRVATPGVVSGLSELERTGRAATIRLGGEERVIAAEDASRYRDALGATLPPGIPPPFLEAVPDPEADLALRYALSHGPFTPRDLSLALGLAEPATRALLSRLVESERLLRGEFRPGGKGEEFCAPEVLRRLKRRSLALARRQAEPVRPEALGRMLQVLHGTLSPRGGLDALLDAVGVLQGAPLPASVLESEILPARIRDYKRSDLDTLLQAGEVVWRGLEPVGERDGKIALYLADSAARLQGPRPSGETLSPRAREVLRVLSERGAAFFDPLHDATGGGYPGETAAALWELVFAGFVTNDTFGALRALVGPGALKVPSFRSRRRLPPEVQGRWSVVAFPEVTPTEHLSALADQLLARYGLVTTEAVRSEGVPGGFVALYPVFRALEEAGRARRGLFVAGLGPAQFALPASVEILRSGSRSVGTVCLSAADPASPYGTLLRWPQDGLVGLGRFPSASVVLVDGALAAYFRRGSSELRVFEEDLGRLRGLAGALHARAREGLAKGSGLLIRTINGADASTHPLRPLLEEAGFRPGAAGFQLSRAGLAPKGA
jgi:ATP-dependent Lhr-like helicase